MARAAIRLRTPTDKARQLILKLQRSSLMDAYTMRPSIFRGLCRRHAHDISRFSCSAFMLHHHTNTSRQRARQAPPLHQWHACLSRDDNIGGSNTHFGHEGLQ